MEEGKTQEEWVKILIQRLIKFHSHEGRIYGMDYKPRSNDVLITTTAKAGTTWMQQICHQIRSADAGGDMTFDEISCAVPWLELAYDLGQDLEADQYGAAEEKPRFFKSHTWYDHSPAFPKTIVVLRDPVEVLKSFYRFLVGWFLPGDSITLDTFATIFWLSRDVPKTRHENASYFVHLVSWYQRMNEDNVLIVFYEDMKEDHRREVARVARFVSNDQHNFDTPETIDGATKNSTFAFMKAHESQFDEHTTKNARNEDCGLAKDAGQGISKVMGGLVKSDTAISPEIMEQIVGKWKEVVEPVTGCATYDELRGKIGSSSRSD